jgi:hypothetical protein
MAKKQTFADKVDKVKAAGAMHCPVCNEIPTMTKIKTFVTEGGRTKLVTKSEKVCKCNSSQIFG